LLLPVLVTPALLAACFSEHTAPSTGGEGVTVGDIFFRSNHNGSANPAVDTVVAGTTVTWTWGSNENLPHSVQSLGSPSFTSSATQAGPGKAYQFTFTTLGTYEYDCAVHGSAMTGTIVVR
jgi:plastocyanin